jgi:predicted membrane protein
MKSSAEIKKLVTGLLVVAAGFLFLLNRLDVLSPQVADALFSWQMVLIAIGVIILAGQPGNIGGWVLIAIGGFFLITDLYVIPTTFSDIFWPSLIIIIGLFIIFKGRQHGGRWHEALQQGEGNTTDEQFEDISIFGGGKKNYHIKNLRSGKIVAVFGGSEIDLTECQLAETGAVLEVFYMFGGSSIHIPADWEARVEVVSVFGGFDQNKRPVKDATKSTGKTLVVKGMAIFGGGELKHFI